MAKRVLVPFDDSTPAAIALEEALRSFASDEIVVLHVLDTNEASHGIEGGAADGWYEAKEAEAAELFETARAIADEYGATLTTVVETGRPAREIVDYTRENGIDRVVMGSHGRSGIERVLVGSVAETVVRNAPVSVTIARRRSDGE